MLIDEMDLNRWGESSAEPDLGSTEAAGGRNAGRTLFERVARGFSEHSIVLPPNARYLGLAAGQAQPELEFAMRLGIKERNVVLVDRNFGSQALSRIRTVGSTIQTVDSGLFRFLRNTPSE